MKKLMVLSVLLITMLSCEVKENICECTEERYETQVVGGSIRLLLVAEFPVGCQEEITNYTEISAGSYYKIKCN